jgi:glycosyltransferase involved in cell wall biosynthesis
MGKPTIIGKTRENAGFMDRENCLISRQGDSQDLARQIKWAHSNQDKAKIIGKEGRNLYESRFSNRNIQSKIESIVEELVNFK